MAKQQEQNRKTMLLSDEELGLFEDAMARDGQSKLTPWIRSVILRYANGELVPKGSVPRDVERELDLLRSMCDQQRELIEGYRLRLGE